MLDNFKAEFHKEVLILIPLSLALNIVMGQIDAHFNFPLFLDTIGTIFISILAGPWVGMITGVLGAIINGIIDARFLPFSIVTIVIGGVAGICARKQLFSSPKKVLLSIFIITFISSLIALPITLGVFNGILHHEYIMEKPYIKNIHDVYNFIFVYKIVANFLDKFISVITALLLIKLLPIKFLSSFELGANYISNKKQ